MCQPVTLQPLEPLGVLIPILNSFAERMGCMNSKEETDSNRDQLLHRQLRPDSLEYSVSPLPESPSVNDSRSLSTYHGYYQPGEFDQLQQIDPRTGMVSALEGMSSREDIVILNVTNNLVILQTDCICHMPPN